VHEGLPARPLPMLIPEPRLPPVVNSDGSVQDYGAQPQYQPAPVPQSNDGDLAERILREVLGIFGN